MSVRFQTISGCGSNPVAAIQAKVFCKKIVDGFQSQKSKKHKISVNQNYTWIFFALKNFWVHTILQAIFLELFKGVIYKEETRTE